MITFVGVGVRNPGRSLLVDRREFVQEKRSCDSDCELEHTCFAMMCIASARDAATVSRASAVRAAARIRRDASRRTRAVTRFAVDARTARMHARAARNCALSLRCSRTR